jgi:triosephosphate isomerase (TIM)
MLVQETKNLLIFAQHMDALPIGRGVGSVLPEAIRAAGAVGVLLNHAEKPLSLGAIQLTIQRADEVGLASMVCAGCLEEVKTIAKMKPNILLAESPELIGTGKRTAGDQENIRRINELVFGIDPEILVLHGAGISSGQDVYEIIFMGAQATGSTSGIIKAKDPFAMLEEMIHAVREAWNQAHHLD